MAAQPHHGRARDWGLCARGLALGAASWLAATPALAQQTQPEALIDPAGAARPAIMAVAVDEGPSVDGDVLGDPVWNRATPTSGFWQTAPDEGRAASERTEVRIVHTPTTLYVGVVCYDSEPSTIVVADSRRDSSLNDTDSFTIILDTYLDQQNGFVFGTSPSGLEYDGQVVNEGQGGGRFTGGGGGQQGGAGGGFNINWDADWEVRTRVTEIGWTAEFAIPFRTLRYPSSDVQAWGMNFRRNIRRRNETAFWAPLPRQFDLFKLSMAGQLRGLAVPGQRNLKITPYVLGELERFEERGTTTALGDTGFDLKYSITPSLTLDATYNTDFAQVEVDDERVNLNRFNLFFPEKRPFFLENAGLFAVGNSGRTEIFFSRRIGISSRGETIPILAGGRVSGLVSGVNIGLLNMQTEAVGDTPANNFGVIRVRKDLPNRSNIGAIVVNRQATGRLAGDEDYNRTVAFDARWGIGENATVQGFVARSQTPGLEGDQYAYSGTVLWDSEAWQNSFEYTEVAPNFNPEVGFLNRTSYRSVNSRVLYRYRPKGLLRLQEIRPHAQTSHVWDFDGFQETGFVHLDSHWEFEGGAEVHTGMNFTREGLIEPFEIFPDVIVPAGTYDHREAVLNSFTNRGAPLSVSFRTVFGGFFGGDRVEIAPAVRYRIGETFNTSLTLSRNDIDLPGGSFVTNLIRWRAAYNFSPRLFVQSLVQYNDRADIWSANLRLGWLQRANTGLFLVYNDARGLGDFTSSAIGRSLILKFSHMFDVLE